ncbi:MAG: CAAX prenyl protease-related protein [Thermoguttaceae bacterium]|jgi:CAAX prenyl protease-like protein|nr:CAAX prenyl protease-related protein [Thermoguttaceae bacterium]
MKTDTPPDPDHPPRVSARARRALLERHPWVTFVLPLGVYLLLTSLEPSAAEMPDGQTVVGAASYPAVYLAKITLTGAALWFVWPGLARFPLRVSPWAGLVGLVGAGIWIGLCELPVHRALAAIGLDRLASLGARTGYNPFERLAGLPVAWAWTFVTVRFAGLVLLVPVAEELFLRGFLMRFVSAADWTEQPIGSLSRAAVAAVVIYPLATHPAVEWPAALVWFALVTALAAKTRNLWDCIAAHAVTNLLLGTYVVLFGAWRLM